MATKSAAKENRRSRFLAEAEADFEEFAGIEDLRGAFETFVRGLYPSAEAPLEAILPRTSAEGGRGLAFPLTSTGGPLRVATGFAELQADGATGDRRPDGGDVIGPQGEAEPGNDELIRAWDEYESAWEDYLAEIRMSGEGGGDVRLSAPTPPSWHKPITEFRPPRA